MDIVIGVVVVVAVLVVMSALTLWSCRAITRIADKKLFSARDIVRELKNGG